MTKLTINIEDPIVRKARIHEIKEGTYASTKVREFLAQDGKGDSASDSALPELPIFKGGSGLQPGLDPSCNRAMISAVEDAV